MLFIFIFPIQALVYSFSYDIHTLVIDAFDALLISNDM